MNLLDRSLQKHLLERMREQFPDELAIRYDQFDVDADKKTLRFNLAYLNELGLTTGGDVREPLMVRTSQRDSTPGPSPLVKGTITAAGIDFLEDDGGLSAILGTVTVRLHADTIRDLIQARIMESEAPPEEKQRLVGILKTMPEAGLKHVATRLIDYGLAQSPNAWQALSSMFG